MTVRGAEIHPAWNAAPARICDEVLARRDAILLQKAMDLEMECLRATEAWELFKLWRGAMVTGRRWVCAYERYADGTVMWYTARYVAQSYTQRSGIAYNDVWELCPSRPAVRAVLSFVTAQDLERHVVDIKEAYLNAPMGVPVYIKQTEGY